MNLHDSRPRCTYAALRKKGLVTRLAINTLNLLDDSGTAKPGHAPDGGFGRESSCARHPAAGVKRFISRALPRSARRRAQNDRKHLMELAEIELVRESHPVDVIEQVAHTNDWS